MVIYDLRCTNEHRFEGWFKTPADFIRQNEGGLLSCPACGTANVMKLPTASRINRHSSSQRVTSDLSVKPEQTPLARLHEYVNRNFTDVGAEFPEQARRIHYGEVQPSPIRGIASADDVRELHDEGVAVVALPPAPVSREKLN